jgi:uncharacterized membrane protein YhiD involved in acid resistance
LKINNYNKSKNKIFIIWGLFIIGVIMVLLTLLFLSINNSQTKLDIQNHDINNEKEQQTYNNILNKIDNEVDKLTNNNQEKDKLVNMVQEKDEFGNIIKKFYNDDGKTIKYIDIFDSQTEKKIMKKHFFDDGQTVEFIIEFNQEGEPIKSTRYQRDGTIRRIVKY